MMRGLEPFARKAFSPLKRVIDAAAKVELSSKPVTVLGKKQMKALSRAFEARDAAGMKGAAKPISPKLDRSRSKDSAEAKSAIQRLSPPERVNPEKKPHAQSTKVKTRSAKQAYIDSHKKMSSERVKTAKDRLEQLRKEQQQKPTIRVRQAGRDAVSPQDRLQRLREGQTQKPRGPELDR